jgi:hypothetical protein
MPLNLAVFNSIANAAGLFGPILIGSVVHHTCSYNVAFVVMGVVLMFGGLLTLTVKDCASEREVMAGLSVELTAATDKVAIADRGNPGSGLTGAGVHEEDGMVSPRDVDIADEL